MDWDWLEMGRKDETENNKATPPSAVISIHRLLASLSV
jgi:hypothetical protein